MKNLKSLVLAGAIALSSPFVLPASDAGAAPSHHVRLLGATVLEEPPRQGVEISALDPDSPLVLQNICGIGDRIVSVDGTPTNTGADLQNAVDALHPFTQVIVRVQLKTWPYDVVPRTFSVPAPR